MKTSITVTEIWKHSDESDRSQNVTNRARLRRQIMATQKASKGSSAVPKN